jgi:hypothetical protein
MSKMLGSTVMMQGRAEPPEAAKRRNGRCGLGLPAAALALLALAACGRAPTEDILRGGVPAMTNLHQASSLPAESVRTVARRDYGWRLIYHPTRAPVNAEQGAARALCGLERRRPERIEHIPRTDPLADPGARVIDIYCA